MIKLVNLLTEAGIMIYRIEVLIKTSKIENKVHVYNQIRGLTDVVVVTVEQSDFLRSKSTDTYEYSLLYMKYLVTSTPQDDIKKIDFLKICTMKRQRKNRKPQMSIYFCNSSFYDIFQNKYFINKSESAPLDILKIIPVDLKRYFYLGLIDGDGCFYFKNKRVNY